MNDKNASRFLVTAAAVGVLLAIVIMSGIVHEDTSCRAGYLFANNIDGSQVQIIGDEGYGVRCEVKK